MPSSQHNGQTGQEGNRPGMPGWNSTADPASSQHRPSDTATISLAGPPQQPPSNDLHNTYYEPGYRDRNPWVEKWEQQGGSEFSLAGTFPHKNRFKGKPIDRSGHQKIQKQPHQSASYVDDEEKGEAEPAPQVPEAEDQGEQNAQRKEERQRQWQESDATAEAEGRLPPKRPGPIRRLTTKLKPQPDPAEEVNDFGEDDQPVPHNVWARIRIKYHRELAEGLGTTIAMFIGISANLAVVTSSESAATYQTMYFAWGFAIMLGIYVAGGGSGAFLNPAITIMLSVFRGFPAKRIPNYILVQIFGAFIGALLAFGIYYDNIIHLDGSLKAESTGIYFYTQPKTWESAVTAFFTEFLGSMVLGCCILALGDSANSPPGAGMHAFIIGLLITCCLMCFSYSTGGCFNGARDLGPRMAAMAVGYPTSAFTAFNNWWIWGPWCATISGSLVGGLIYDLCIFRGNESPVNFSRRRLKYEGRKMECTWLKWLKKEKKAKNVEKEVEDGFAASGSDDEMGRAGTR